MVCDLVNEVVGQIYFFFFGYLVNEVWVRDFVFLGCVWVLRKAKMIIFFLIQTFKKKKKMV